MNLKKIGTVALVTVAVVAAGIRIRAAGPTGPNLLKSHFTADDGLPDAVIDAIDQTSDGYLWLATGGNNLVRFDGRAFYTFEQRLVTLTTAPGGDLWLGTREGLVRIPSNDFNQFTLTGLTTYHPGPARETDLIRLRVARNGVLWVGTQGGLFRYDGTQFVALGPRVAVGEIEEGPDGHILTETPNGFIEWDGSTMVPHPGLAERLGVKEADILRVLRDRRGNTWYSTAMGLARESGGHIEKLGPYRRVSNASRMYEDAQGTIWIGTDEGLFRATASDLELVDAGMQVRSLFSDRDGNLWVGTNGDGLYRFRHPVVRMFGKDDGLPGIVIQTVMTSSDGTLWTGANCGGLSRFDGTRFQTFSEKQGLLNDCVWALAEDPNHDIWVGTWGGGAFRFHDGTFTQVSKKEGMADDRVTSIVAGRDGTMWFGTRGGLSRLRDGEFRTYKTADGLSVASVLRVFEDRTGVLWVGTRQGLHRMVGDRFELFPATPKAVVTPSGESRDGSLYVADDARRVNVRVDKGRAEVIPGLAPGVDVLETEQGDVWFGGQKITRARRDQLAQVRAHDEPFDYESFSVADGLATSDVGGFVPNLALTKDGKLWAARTQGLAQFDLARLPYVSTKPSISLTSVTIGRNTVRPAHDIVLPAGTNHLQVDFSAVEISSPEKIRMQYRLDDVDAEWLDAGRDPHAIYSTLPPGTHAFHIRACNRSGIWDRQGVVFSITQLPFIYQTRGFIAAMSVAGVLLVVAVYRLRVRQISRVMSARFDERLAERTRVARELHDTLLQTVQGGKMVADHALKDTADHARAIRALEQLSTWLTQATEEGRTALNSLRASATETNDLAEALRRALDESRGMSGAETSFAVQGEAVEMHPVVRDEIYRIGYEAIRNACAHSGGSLIDVTLEYGHDLKLRISDNGVGIDAETVDKGKGSHFGLRGMRERAERIGAKFTLVSAPDSGTVITLVVPGRIAFRTAGPIEKHR